MSAKVTSAVVQRSPEIKPKPMAPRKPARPVVIQALSVIDAVAGAFVVVIGALGVFLYPTLGAILVLIGASSVVAAYGLLNVLNWTKRILLIAGLAYLALGILVVLANPFLGALVLLIGVVQLYYLRQPVVKNYLSTTPHR
jgi:hypothetical protein